MMVHSVKMPVDFGVVGIKRKCRPLATMVRIKRSIVEVGSEENSLSRDFIIAIARINNEPNY